MKFLSSTKFQPVYWVGLSVLILAANLNTDPYLDFPVLFIIPVLLASWYSGRRWGLALAIAMPLVRLFFTVVVWDVPWTTVHSIVNASIRITVFSTFAILTDMLQQQQYRIKVLEGLIPICHNCKRIRDGENHWLPIDVYLNQRAGAIFLQGICSDCLKLLGSQMSEQKQ
jgi:hypothetical protein